MNSRKSYKTRSVSKKTKSLTNKLTKNKDRDANIWKFDKIPCKIFKVVTCDLIYKILKPHFKFFK